METRKRVACLIAVCVGTLAAVGLLALAFMGDVGTTGLAASVGGAVAGIVGAVASLVALLRASAPSQAPVTMRAGRGSILAQGDVESSRARVPRTGAVAPEVSDVITMAAGDGSVLSGGSLRDVSAGEEDQRS